MNAFTGCYTHALDNKHRVSVPRKILDALRAHDSADEVVITAGLDGCLFLYTKQGFDAIARQLAERPLGEEATRDFQRNFFASTERCPVDGNGRLVLADALREFAGIDEGVTFIGVGPRVELWRPETWNERQTRTRPHYTKQAKDVLR